MGLKRRAGTMLHNLRERVRVPPHARLIGQLLQDLQVQDLLDIGANGGQFAHLMRRAGYRGRILSLEPVSDAHATLVRAAAADPRWEVEQVAVGAAPGRQVIHVAANSVSSSLLPMGERHLELAPESGYTRDEEVTVTTVEALVAAHGIDPRTTMLKADVQGLESAVLDGAGAALGDYAVLLLELSLLELYEGQELMPELLARLTSQGFELWTFFPAYVDRVNGRMWWADGLFVRADLAARYPHRSREV
jgi:FkbM family methyltransferase